MKISNECRLMEQTKNKNAFLTQVLVRNYLLTENKDSNINIYGELINDIDSFTTKLEKIEELNKKFTSKSPCKEYPKTIDVFLSIVDENEESIEDNYTNSYDVKYTDELLFVDLLKLLTKMIYPKNTFIQLIYVSSDITKYDKLSMSPLVDTFNGYKTKLLCLPEKDLYLVINNLINDSSYRKLSVNDAFMKVFNKLKSNKLNIDYKNNITDEFMNIFMNNFRKCTIRELLLKDLINTPMKQETLKEEYGIYAQN